MTYLIDTNVLSERRRPAPDPGVTRWFRSIQPDTLRLSVITVGEIRRGVRKLQLRNDHLQANVYQLWLTETRAVFADRLVPVTSDVADLWGHHDVGHPMPVADGLIGATAQAHGWTLVTRNVKDFEHLGIQLLNPFSG